jgi:hypothetical protein
LFRAGVACLQELEIPCPDSSLLKSTKNPRVTDPDFTTAYHEGRWNYSAMNLSCGMEDRQSTTTSHPKLTNGMGGR